VLKALAAGLVVGLWYQEELWCSLVQEKAEALVLAEVQEAN